MEGVEIYERLARKLLDMKIALIGFGKMGREIDSIAREQGETISCIFEIDRVVRPEALADVDVCIEFSTPDAALSETFAQRLKQRKDIVVGTTGWYEHLPEVRSIVQGVGIAVFFKLFTGCEYLFSNRFARGRTDEQCFRLRSVHSRSSPPTKGRQPERNCVALVPAYSSIGSIERRKS